MFEAFGVRAGELDGTASASGQAALALREGREDVLRGARAILAAWRELRPDAAARD